MLKKTLLVLTLSIAFSTAMPLGATAQDEVNTQYTEVAALPDGQEAVEGEWTPSQPVNTVEESATARKLAAQQQKAKNAQTNDPYGLAVTIIAMAIVLAVLIVLSILFLFFGKISALLLTKKKKQAQGQEVSRLKDTKADVDSGEAIAAIAAALAEHFSQKHDVEDTILTIKNVKRSYSPWNSKIYSLRQLPLLQHNPKR